MAAPRKPKDTPELDAGDGGLCPEHFPNGWDHIAGHFETVGCEHGGYHRPAGPAEPDGNDDD